MIVEKTVQEKPLDEIVADLEAALGIKLHADLKNDVVNGSVSSWTNGDGTVTVRVEVYEATELPDSKRSTTLAKPAVMPAENDVKAAI